MKKLAICGKTIDMSKVAEKSSAQFRYQLTQNGITLTDEQFDALWEQVQKRVAKEAATAAESETTTTAEGGAE